jgi:hypothetical protein
MQKGYQTGLSMDSVVGNIVVGLGADRGTRWDLREKLLLRRRSLFHSDLRPLVSSGLVVTVDALETAVCSVQLSLASEEDSHRVASSS